MSDQEIRITPYRLGFHLQLRLVIADRSLTLSELLGAALAFLLWTTLREMVGEPVRETMGTGAGAW